MLAVIFYAGLQPGIQQRVAQHAQEVVRRQKKEQADERIAELTQQVTEARLQKELLTLTSTPAVQTLPATPESTPTEMSPKQASPAPTARPEPTRLTQLAGPVPTLASSLSRPVWQALLLVTLTAALTAGGSAWWQYRHEPDKAPVPQVIESEILNALLKLEAHQQMQKRLGMAPRQIKRFNSRARVQHSQLCALVRNNTQAPDGQPVTSTLPKLFLFPVTCQLQAFQLLLLLEEIRQQPGAPLPINRTEFTQRLRKEYAQHDELTAARKQAAQQSIFNKGLVADVEFIALNQQVEVSLLEQLYEMNVGLLA
ncbi:hypothetical protein [Hymenobacter citatus]|nr:hypothetical protein [Hymenobacter citatus]